MDLYEIVYQSRAEEKGSFTLDDLFDLMVKSREYNLNHQITGCLVYHKFTFIQILEGPKKEVQHLYGKIIKDKRHTHVDLVWEGKVKKRGFEGWSMSLMNLNEHGLDRIFSDFLDTGNFTFDVPGVLTTGKSILLSMKDNI